jgi:hypothetical protein
MHAYVEFVSNRYKALHNFKIADFLLIKKRPNLLAHSQKKPLSILDKDF